MENVVPSALQRLRASDIFRMAGLKAASLGQEYCRIGAVHNTQRQGSRIAGIIEVPHVGSDVPAQPVNEVDTGQQAATHLHHCAVEVEIQNSATWLSTCTCDANPGELCVHAAALLYQWLARPMSFTTASLPPIPLPLKVRADESEKKEQEGVAVTKPARSFEATRPLTTQRGPAPLDNIVDMLNRSVLGDLRAIAREYEITTNGMNKQQIAEAVLEVLKQPEAVRRLAATLEKSPRQLLAALTLAGGAMTDEDLRGLFERFTLGQPNQLQSMLQTLQGKALLFRTSLNSSTQQRIGLSGSLLDIGWYVPMEVRAALRVTVPITTYDVQRNEDNSETPPRTLQTERYQLLADLLLVARMLDGYHLEHEEERGLSPRPHSIRPSPATDGSIALPAPADLPDVSLIEFLRTEIGRPPEFLRFAVRLLRMADILHKDDEGTPYLRVLPNAAQLLLGPARSEAARDLFELWLTQSSYHELFDLQEDGLRLRCRATALSHPILRVGELEAENSEARQSLMALLAQAPLNQWISFTAFARFIYRLNPLFLQKRQRLFSSPHWWIEQEEGRALRPLQLSDWLHAEMHYITRLVSGPLYWWGICDLARSYDGRLLAFRLTPTASWLFNGQALVEEGPPASSDERRLTDSLEVINDEEILIACSSYAWPIITLLETFTEAAGVHNDHLCYRLTPKVLGDALSQGKRPIELQMLLRYMRQNNPQQDSALARMLEQLECWIASYGRVRIYTGMNLLETADTVVMRELSATTSIDEQIVQAIHPTLLILKKPGTERVIDDLKRRGQAPLLHDEEYYGAK